MFLKQTFRQGHSAITSILSGYSKFQSTPVDYLEELNFFPVRNDQYDAVQNTSLIISEMIEILFVNLYNLTMNQILLTWTIPEKFFANTYQMFLFQS